MLMLLSRIETTNPRDKIYALLVFNSIWADMDGREMPSFKLDYKKTVADMYRDLIRYFLALPKNYRF